MNALLASGALQFAFEKATIEGKITIGVLLTVSLVSWSVIISKSRQLAKATKKSREFFKAFRETTDPLELARSGKTFDGAPVYELYAAGAEELDYLLGKNPIDVGGTKVISQSSFDSVKVVLERTAGAESLSLEKGMIVLSTAVAGGPFIGLLGTVWGVMETFSGIARAASASLTAMAPGVAGALIATVIGLLVAIPAMFAYNFMVTTIRGLTQEMDHFTSEIVTGFEHRYVDNRPLAEELADAIESKLGRLSGNASAR
jgi:biopolymer transport protein ExbB/TolQ